MPIWGAVRARWRLRIGSGGRTALEEAVGPREPIVAAAVVKAFRCALMPGRKSGRAANPTMLEPPNLTVRVPRPSAEAHQSTKRFEEELWRKIHKEVAPEVLTMLRGDCPPWPTQGTQDSGHCQAPPAIPMTRPASSTRATWFASSI